MFIPRYISKSMYIEGIKCPKMLWTRYHDPSKIPQETAIDRIRMDDGQLVGQKARELYPDGVRLKREPNPEVMHKTSMEALKLRKPLFEPGFVHNNGYALADILVPAGRDEWELYEVKASTSIDSKTANSVLSGRLNYYYADVAFQKYVYTGAGIKFRKFSIMHLNKDYIYDGKKLMLSELIKPDSELDAKILEHIHSAIEAHLPEVEKNIGILLKVLAENAPPKGEIGRQCKGCVLEGLCENEYGLPKKGNVMRLRMDRDGLRFKMLAKKVFSMSDIELTPGIVDPKRTQIEAHKAGKPVKKRKALATFLKKFKYPLYFLDFETISTAVPIYAGTHSYQQIPFQFSLHVVKKKGSKPEHYSYIAPGDVDPRPEIIARLNVLLKDKGSIIAYNASFEKGRIEEACLGNEEKEKWFNDNISGRFIDLEEPFDKFNYYDPRQEGSTSIKHVYPALTGKDTYEGLVIAEGGDAMKQYMDVTFKEVDENTRQRVRAELERYCEQDTLSMVEVYEKLQEVAGEP